MTLSIMTLSIMTLSIMTLSIDIQHNSIVRFATTIQFHISLIHVGKAGAYQRGAPLGLPSNGRLLALQANIKLD